VTKSAVVGEARGVGQRLASRSLYAMIVVLDAHV